MCQWKTQNSWNTKKKDFFYNGCSIINYINHTFVFQHSSSCLLPVGHLAGLNGFVCSIDLTYLRDSLTLTNIRIRVFRTRHSPYYFFFGGGGGRVHISLLCPPSTCACMSAVNAWGCVIDLLVHGCHQLFVSGHRKQCKPNNSSVSIKSLLFIFFTSDTPTLFRRTIFTTSRFCVLLFATQTVSQSKTQSLDVMKMSTNRPDQDGTRVASVIGHSVTTRPTTPSHVIFGQAYWRRLKYDSKIM